MEECCSVVGWAALIETACFEMADSFNYTREGRDDNVKLLGLAIWSAAVKIKSYSKMISIQMALLFFIYSLR